MVVCCQDKERRRLLRRRGTQRRMRRNTRHAGRCGHHDRGFCYKWRVFLLHGLDRAVSRFLPQVRRPIVRRIRAGHSERRHPERGGLSSRGPVPRVCRPKAHTAPAGIDAWNLLLHRAGTGCSGDRDGRRGGGPGTFGPHSPQEHSHTGAALQWCPDRGAVGGRRRWRRRRWRGPRFRIRTKSAATASGVSQRSTGNRAVARIPEAVNGERYHERHEILLCRVSFPNTSMALILN
mmetsp:Transcript_28510/g.66937  ORF Transcript_28510/g.66937 Transcript_28510/m.66937 type:complete len:235 (+) Transcript_28510:957-1661(+)